MSSEWPEVALEDVVGTVNTGLDAIKRAPIIEQETGIKCLRIQDISQSKKFSAWGNTEVREQDFEKYRLRKNEIIMARTCSPGICLLVKSDMNAVFNNGLARVRALEDKISPVFLLYIFKSKEFADYIYGISHGTSVQLNMKVGDLTRYRLRLPPLSVQNGIASILSLMDDRIALLRETNTTLEAIAQALFKSWFVDFDPVHAKARGEPPQGMDDATAALFPDSFEESELGMIPKGWRAGSLGCLALTARKQIKPEAMTADMLYVGLEHIPRQSLGLDSWGTANELESAKSCFEKGDILFGKLRPYFHKIVIAPFSGVCSTDILVCKAKSSDFHGVVAMHLFSTELVAYANRLSNGAKMPRVNWKDLADYPLAIPPSKVALAYSQTVQPMFEQITENVLQAQTLAQLRDTLLPKLISGQLRLPEAEALLAEELP